MYIIPPKSFLVLFLVNLICFDKCVISITFDVSDVDTSTGRFRNKSIRHAAEGIRKYFEGSASPGEPLKFETGNVNLKLANLNEGIGFNKSKELLHSGSNMKHGFVSATVSAWNLHLPLELSPDDFWSMVALSLAHHLGQKQFAEKYRDKFVNHAGRKHLVVVVDKYKMRPHGDVTTNKAQWPNVVRDFMKRIIKNTNTNFAETMTTGAFSTSTITELTAYRITLMESMKHYFFYDGAVIGCGIPSVTLLGTEADYVNLLERIDNLIELFDDFRWYLVRIRIHAQRLLDSIRGSPNVGWWRRLVKVEKDDYFIEDYISGWITDWMAYYSDEDGVFRRLEPRPDQGIIEPLKLLNYPAVTMTDVMLKDCNTTLQHPMVFSGGFLGVSQNE